MTSIERETTYRLDKNGVTVGGQFQNYFYPWDSFSYFIKHDVAFGLFPIVNLQQPDVTKYIFYLVRKNPNIFSQNFAVKTNPDNFQMIMDYLSQHLPYQSFESTVKKYKKSWAIFFVIVIILVIIYILIQNFLK